jgi:single-strand DNA-binding protein
LPSAFEWRDGDTSFLRVNVWRGRPSTWPTSWPRGSGSWSPAGCTRGLGDSRREKRSVTELEADEIGASLKWAIAKVERVSQRGNGERSSGRERQAERGGDFNDTPPDLLSAGGIKGLQP